MATNWKPDDSQVVVPYLVVKGVAGVIDFAKHAFEAKETERMSTPDGMVMHAEMRIGDSIIMMGDPMQNSAMPGMLYVYVKDTDAAYKRAIAAGGTSVSEPKDEFYGHRCAAVKDASGNVWWIATRIEDVSTEEILQRMANRPK